MGLSKAVLESTPQTGDELAAKDTTEHMDGEKEVRAGSDPAGVIEGEPTGGDDTVDVGMEPELLVSGVEHAEEADLGPEMSGIAGDFEKGFCTAAEQQIIDNLFIVRSHGGELRRRSENDMDVTRAEKFAAPCGEPPFPSAGLTLWTMAIATTVVGDGGTLSTAGALIDMAAKCGGATAGIPNRTQRVDW